MDIIEKVQGPTPWVSPIVVVPKPSGEIRLCVDMRKANDAIVRERHPIPTVDEVLQDMSQSSVFSKLDLKWGYHQLELSEELISWYHNVHNTCWTLPLQETDVLNNICS